MFCSISGEVPLEPVVSKRTGHLYEKRIIEKYIKSEGRCPVSNVDMSEADLLAVAVNPVVKPRVATSASIPGLLQMFQNEWDELMLETYTLKQHLDTTRQELSQALYQHDAACRVIARVMRERDEARALLSSLPAGQSTTHSTGAVPHAVSSSSSKMDVEPSASGMTEGVLAVINDTCKALGATRKGRKPPPNLATKDDLASYTCTHTHTAPHKSDKPGVTCLDVFSAEGGDVALTGGVDKNVVLTSLQTGTILATLSGHSKQVNSVGRGASLDEIFSCSADKTVRVWKRQSGGRSTTYKEVVTYIDHSDDVTSISVHPSGKYLLSTSADKSWKFYDVSSSAGGAIVSVDMDSKLRTGKFHPDGVLIGVGTDTGNIKLYDVRTQSEAAAMATEARCAVSCIAFSENGYTFASSAADGAVKLWDLRKVKCVNTFEYSGKGAAVAPVAFDYSGSYLAMARGTGIDIVNTKEFTVLAGFLGAHSKAITALHWGSGSDASSIVSVSLDRAIKVFSK